MEALSTLHKYFWHIWRFNMAIRGFPMLKNATLSQPAWIWTVEFQKSVQDYWSMYRKWSESASAGNWQQWHLVGSQHCPAFSRDICCEGIGPVGLLPWAFGWLGGAWRAVKARRKRGENLCERYTMFPRFLLRQERSAWNLGLGKVAKARRTGKFQEPVFQTICGNMWDICRNHNT